jgi:glutathione S-transferase
MLEELGEPFSIELLNLRAGDQRKPEYLAINPMGKVPTLVDGDTVVSEVSAICCYLADA